MWSDTLARQGRAVGRCDGGVFGEEELDGVAAERRVLAGGEQRVLGLTLAFVEPLVQDGTGLAGQRDGAPLSSLAGDLQVSGGAQMQVTNAKVGEL